MLAAVTALLAAPSAGAVVRVVSPAGKDAWPGTAAKPWRSLQWAVNHAAPGMTIVARPGAYAPFVIARGGAAGAPLVIRGPGARIVGRGTFGIKVLGARYVAIRDLTVTGLRTRGSIGVYVVGGTNVSLGRMKVAANRGYGVFVDGAVGFQVVASEITGNATGVQVAGAASGEIAGNRVHDNDKMLRNTLWPVGDDNGAVGVGFAHTTGPILVHGNLIWGNVAPSDDFRWDGGAFEIFEASGVWIYGNRLWNNENVLETGTGSGAPCVRNRFFRNVAYDDAPAGHAVGMILRCADHMLVANNTFAGLHGFAFDIGDQGPFAGSIQGLAVVNNVAVTSAAHPYSLETARSPYLLDHNVVWSAPVGGPLAWVAGRGQAPGIRILRRWTRHELNGAYARPRFTAPAAHVYSLQPGSPARHRGMPLTGITVGPAPDAGAY